MYRVKPYYIINRSLKEINSMFDGESLLDIISDILSKSDGPIKVLEIGCGEGRTLLELCSIFVEDVIFFGINKAKGHGPRDSSGLLKVCRKYKIRIPDKLPKISIQNAEDMDFDDNTFDFIFSSVSFIHHKRKEKSLEETYRALKLGGKALIHLDSDYKSNKNPEWFTPRMIIKKNGKIMPLREFLKKFNNVELRSFVMKDRRKRRLKRIFYLLMKKNKSSFKLNLDLKGFTHVDRTRSGVVGGNRGGYICVYEAKE